MRRKNIPVAAIFSLLTLNSSLSAQSLYVVETRNLLSRYFENREHAFFELFDSEGKTFGVPVWSPDGKRIAFDFNYLKIIEGAPFMAPSLICLVNSDGTDLEIISEQSDFDPSWSPDGTQIVFKSSRTRRGHQIFKMNADGTDQIQLTDYGCHSPAWSPDGRRIAFKNSGIWTMNTDGTGASQITSHHSDSAPSWSPDGERIVFSSGKSGQDNIWVIHSDGTDLAQLTKKGGGHPSWSPDGNWIAFERGGQIWVVRHDGSREFRLRTEFTAGRPSWSPDGKQIAVAGFGLRKKDIGLFILQIVPVSEVSAHKLPNMWRALELDLGEEGQLELGEYLIEYDAGISESGRNHAWGYVQIRDRRGSIIKRIEGWRVQQIGWDDLTDDGVLEIIITTYSGGAHCCSAYYIYSLKDILENILIFNFLGGETWIEDIKDLDGNGTKEIIVRDGRFAYFADLPYAGSPFIYQVLCYEDDKYREATQDVTGFIGKKFSESLSSRHLLKGTAVEIYAYSILLGREEEGWQRLMMLSSNSLKDWLLMRKKDIINRMKAKLPISYEGKCPCQTQSPLMNFCTYNL